MNGRTKASGADEWRVLVDENFLGRVSSGRSHLRLVGVELPENTVALQLHPSGRCTVKRGNRLGYGETVDQAFKELDR